MGLQSVERKLELPIPLPVGNEAHPFDLEHYRIRMIQHLGEAEGDNRIFFEALDFAYGLHAGQRRKSGAPYISHPCAVAEILARELRFKDPVLLAAALLHDVVEDVPYIQLDDIEHHFGSTVAELVDGCTKLTRSHLDRAALKDLTHSKIFLSASRRLGVLIIKLADRLHNLRTLHYLPQSKRQRIAQETVEIYAPIAARFNIFPLKRELYHLALSYLYPRKSKKILQFIRALRSSEKLSGPEGTLRELFAGAPYGVVVRSRTKGLGSYYSPLKRSIDIANAENHVDFALILQTEDLLDCYHALGVVSTSLFSIPRSVRDFIANPKNNGYRSLHVRVHLGGENYLVKIRTPLMDTWANYGILSEWSAQKPMSDEHWQEISDLLRTIGEYSGAGSQRKALIRLSESEETFAYSPKGDIYYLPKGSLVLDFAYKIHSELGDYCEGALVNGEWAPPTRQIQDGDTVEIFTSTELLDVDPDLEELCKTPKARTAISRHLQQKRLRHARDFGRQILIQELERHGASAKVLEEENTQLILEFLNIKDLTDLLIRIGQDLLSPRLFLYYLDSPKAERDRNRASGSVSSPPLYQRNVLSIAELDKAIHKFARCCNPYPGQEDVVATLSERGTTFHHKDCQDLHHRHALQPQQLLDVRWDQTSAWRHPLQFHFQLLQETIASLLPQLRPVPPSIQIRTIESALDKYDQPMVKLNVRLHSYRESQSLFGNFARDKLVIEDYEREGALKRS